MTFSRPRITNVYEFFRDLPVTKVILAVWVLNFLLSILTVGGINRLLVYVPGLIPNGITGLVTYPLAMGVNFFGLLFGGLMMWQFGGSLERSWTSRNFLLFLLATSAAAALVWTLGVWLFSLFTPLGLGAAALGSPWIMIASIIYAWSWLNPEQTIMVWFVLPVKAKWIGWAAAAGMFFILPLSAFGAHPLVFLLGVFALGGIAVAYVWVWYRNTWGWIPRRPKEKRTSRTLRHPSSTIWGTMTRPYREWQRRRRIAQLERTFSWDDDGQD